MLTPARLPNSPISMAPIPIAGTLDPDVDVKASPSMGAVSEPVRVVGLVLHPRNDVSASVRRVLEWAGAHGVTVLGLDRDGARLPDGVQSADERGFVARVAGVLSLGGDGTMLGALRLVADRPVPVLGVIHGNLGFLTEVEPGDLEGALSRTVGGDFSVERRGALRADDGPGGVRALTAFNDLVLDAARRGAAVDVELAVGADAFGHYRADAVVVATPNGSTAYSYAAGGPVVSPSASAVTVTPVAPMSGISRPLVLGPDEPVTLTVRAGAGAAGRRS